MVVAQWIGTREFATGEASEIEKKRERESQMFEICMIYDCVIDSLWSSVYSICSIWENESVQMKNSKKMLDLCIVDKESTLEIFPWCCGDLWNCPRILILCFSVGLVVRAWVSLPNKDIQATYWDHSWPGKVGWCVNFFCMWGSLNIVSQVDSYITLALTICHNGLFGLHQSRLSWCNGVLPSATHEIRDAELAGSGFLASHDDDIVIVW